MNSQTTQRILTVLALMLVVSFVSAQAPPPPPPPPGIPLDGGLSALLAGSLYLGYKKMKGKKEEEQKEQN